MDQTVFTAYLDLERTHFWRVGKRKLIFEWLSKVCPPNSGSCLDVGGAASVLTQELSLFGKVTVIEPDAKMAEIASSLSSATVVQGSFPGLPVETGFDLITLLDVLEHLDDDLGALVELRRHLNPDGYFLVTVPAYMWLWSEHDEILHHKRRYTKKELLDRLVEADFDVVQSSYYTSLLLPIMAAQRIAGRIRSWIFPNRTIEYRAKTPIAPVNRLFSFIMTIERILLRITPLPAGGSIIALCKQRGFDDSNRSGG